MTEEKGPSSPHVAEAWKQGFEWTLRYGWHCLTCEDEGDAFRPEDAERMAQEHMQASAADREEQSLAERLSRGGMAAMQARIEEGGQPAQRARSEPEEG